MICLAIALQGPGWWTCYCTTILESMISEMNQVNMTKHYTISNIYDVSVWIVTHELFI